MEEASWIKAKTLVMSHLPKAEMFQREAFQFLTSGPVKDNISVKHIFFAESKTTVSKC